MQRRRSHIVTKYISLDVRRFRAYDNISGFAFCLEFFRLDLAQTGKERCINVELLIWCAQCKNQSYERLRVMTMFVFFNFNDEDFFCVDEIDDCDFAKGF